MVDTEHFIVIKQY